jgi:Zn-finger nucleic acid-binding protein
MQCPVDRTTLVTLQHHGVPTEYCPQCRGMWLVAGTLQQIVERAVDEIEIFSCSSGGKRATPVAGLITTAGIRR